MQKTTMLIVLDGFGVAQHKLGNAPALASMPFYNTLLKHYPHKILEAAGSAVGLMPGMIGNSEVGHLTLGAGRVIPANVLRLTHWLQNYQAVTNCLVPQIATLGKGSAVHVTILLSDAGVHSHTAHLYLLLDHLTRLGVGRVVVHAVLDGRDVDPQSASGYLGELDSYIRLHPSVSLGSVIGRFYAMDRDTNWDRTAQAYQMLTGSASRMPHWQDVLTASYADGITDEFIKPHLLQGGNFINPGDGVIFLNFRPDRMRQLASSFVKSDFVHFNNPLCTGKGTLAFCLGATLYDQALQGEKISTFLQPVSIQDTLFDVLEREMPQATTCLIAETEKYAHVTYFFRGMRDVVSARQERILIPSIKARDYKAHPEMSAQAITNELIRNIRAKGHLLYLVNYANPDMVGHSGDLEATMQACSFIDQQLSLLYHEVVSRLGGTMMIVGDHGNAEMMINQDGTPRTAHTVNPVPFIVVGNQYEHKVMQGGTAGLSCVAPTILEHLGIRPPPCMDKSYLPK